MTEVFLKNASSCPISQKSKTKQKRALVNSLGSVVNDIEWPIPSVRCVCRESSPAGNCYSSSRTAYSSSWMQLPWIPAYTSRWENAIRVWCVGFGEGRKNWLTWRKTFWTWSITNNKRRNHRYFHSDQCYLQVLFDVLWVCQPGLCVAVTAQDAKLETTIQVLPLVRWIICRASYVHVRS